MHMYVCIYMYMYMCVGPPQVQVCVHVCMPHAYILELSMRACACVLVHEFEPLNICVTNCGTEAFMYVYSHCFVHVFKVQVPIDRSTQACIHVCARTSI